MPDKDVFVFDQSHLQSPQIQSAKASSVRSQSPAKRLKSEEPPPITVDDPEPMDEDSQPPASTPAAAPPSTDGLDGASESGRISAPSTAASTTATISSGQPPSTDATSTIASLPPSIDEQANRVWQSKMSTPLNEGEAWFVVSTSWLKRFFAQSPEHAKEMSLSKEDAEGEVGPIDNSDIVDNDKLRELVKRKSNDSMLSPSPANDQLPSPTTAEPVWDSRSEPHADKAPESQGAVDVTVADDFIPIIQGSLGEEYEIFPADIWAMLVSWYGVAKGSPVIRRKVVNTGEDDGAENLQVELYPPLFTVYKLRTPVLSPARDKVQDPQSPKKIVVGRSEGFQKFLKKVKTLSGVDSGRKIRLWKLQGDPTVEEPSKKEKGAGKFRRMIVEMTDFVRLSDTEDRELLNIKDETENKNYNGHLRLNQTNLVAGGAIIVEEQNSDGEWASEAPQKTVKRFGQEITVAKPGPKSTLTSKASSRSSSPSKTASFLKRGLMTRGRDRRAGRVQGKCGLSNLGNTCYMNSALQCLRSVKELSEYFLLGEFEKELNPDNPLAHHGKVATVYSQLLKTIFSIDCPSSVSPGEFKRTIGRFAPSFSGYQQQDSQEFLAFLLDGLHEDLNRIKKKPYIEKPDSTDDMVGNPEKVAGLATKHWEIYKARNDSAVADLFGGLYKSTLVCPTCSKVSITFDPFMDLTLPLPIESYWSKIIYFFPKNGRIMQLQVELDKNASMKMLKEYIGRQLGIDPGKIMGSEVYSSKFYKHFEDGVAASEQITPNDLGYFFELDDTPTNYPGPPKTKKRSMFYTMSRDSDDDEDPDGHESDNLLVPVFSQRIRPKQTMYGRSSSDGLFGIPFFIVLNKEEAQSYETILEKIVEKYQQLTTRDLYDGTAPGEAAEVEDAAGEDAIGEDEGSSVENIEKPKAEEGPRAADEEMDGFVDVSMKDAESLASSDVAAKKPTKTGRRKVPTQIGDLFNLKVHAERSKRLPTMWNTAENSIDITTRMGRELPGPEPVRKVQPVQERASALFGHLKAKIGGSGRASPTSNISDVEEDDFQDAPEPTEDTMQGSSDEDEDGMALSSVNDTAFHSVDASNFYGHSSNNSSTRAFKTPSRGESPLPMLESPALVKWGEAIIVEWNDQGYEDIFGGNNEDDLRGCELWSNPVKREDPELKQRQERRQSKRTRGIHLEDCLDEFAKEETLSEGDTWYCPSCKEHRRATKKFELWKCPDILIIHLKRFSSSRNFRDKIDVMIHCPIENLDLSDRVGLKEEGKLQEYELFAVDNHYGGLGGGHYTAYTKNWIDGKWYYCDDASVSETSQERVVTAAAYLLFYRRKSSGKPLGGPAYERILTPDAEKRLLPPATTDDEAEVEAETGSTDSREPSPQPPASSSSNGYTLGPVGNTTLWGTTTTALDDEDVASIPPSYDHSQDDPIVESTNFASWDKTIDVDADMDGDEEMQLVTVPPQPVDDEEDAPAAEVTISESEQL